MDTLWIEAGEMSGGSRNQIEFETDLAEFFVTELPALSEQVKLALSIAGRPWVDCGLVAKQTSFGVDIYRLGLVTAAKGGDDYQGRVVRFDRHGGRYFNVTVVDHGSDEHVQWRAESDAGGNLGRTGSAAGREYGYL